MSTDTAPGSEVGGDTGVLGLARLGFSGNRQVKSPEPQFTHQESSGGRDPPWLGSCHCSVVPVSGQPVPPSLAIPPGPFTPTSGSLWGQGIVTAPPQGTPARTSQQTGRSLKDVVAHGGCTHLLRAAEATPHRPCGSNIGCFQEAGSPGSGRGQGR